jgi:tetratricopeptide (TPR) repeat protein
MFDYALTHLQKVMHVSNASLPQAYQQRLCEIIADAAHLVGYIAWDLNYRDVTNAAYALALQAATESSAPAAHALVLGDMTFASLFSGKSHEALPLIIQAKQLVTADGTPVLLQAWIASVAAETEASLHNETAGLWDSASLHDLETAERVISTCTPDENDTSRLRTGFDVVRLAGYKGTCYLHLRRAEEARAAFTQSLALLSPTRMISKAMDLTKLAEAHRQLGSAQMACTVAIEALNIAQQIGSTIILQEVQALRQRFSPTGEVRDLDERLVLFAAS